MRVFISHASEDSEAAGEIARAIASRGHDVIARDSITEALRSADAMVVLVSPQSAERCVTGTATPTVCRGYFALSSASTSRWVSSVALRAF